MSVLDAVLFLIIGAVFILLLVTLIAYLGKVYMKKSNKKFVP